MGTTDVSPALGASQEGNRGRTAPPIISPSFRGPVKQEGRIIEGLPPESELQEDAPGGHSLSRDLMVAGEGVLLSGGGGHCGPPVCGNHQGSQGVRVRVSAQELTGGVGQAGAAPHLLQSGWLYLAPEPCHMFIFLNDQK